MTDPTHVSEGKSEDPFDRMLRIGFPSDPDQSDSELFDPEHQALERVRDFQPGQTMSGYELIERLGEGGMATVWRARQVSVERDVALKFIHPEKCHRTVLRRFTLEAVVGAQLMHPWIVAVHDYCEDDGLPWISMELVEGGRTFKTWIRQRWEDDNASELSPSHAVDCAALIEKVARALQYVHERRIVHRDISPANIFLTTEGVPKLADFGLAQMLDTSRITEPGATLGTRAYWSPEHSKGDSRSITEASDIFSLGIVLYEALLFRRPFRAKTLREHEHNLRCAEPAPMSASRELAVPKPLEYVCLKALNKAPKERYGSAAAFADDLARFCRGEPVLAGPPGALVRARRWVRQNRRLAAWFVGSAAAVAVLVAVVFGLLAVNRTIRRDQRMIENVALGFLDSSALERLSLLDESAGELTPFCGDDLEAIEAWISEADRLWKDRLNLIQRSDEFDRMRLLGGAPLDVSGFTQEAIDTHAALQGLSDGNDEKALQLLGWLANSNRRLAAMMNRVVNPHFGLASRQPSMDYGMGMRRRREIAQAMQERLGHGGSAWEAWDQDRSALAARYGREIAVQSDLVPLGQDPETKLWEFAHLPSGEIPARGAHGRLRLDKRSSLVFVLVPGTQVPARFGRALSDSEPRVDIDPFFISKYEVSQAQWERWTGESPSTHCPGSSGVGLITPMHPVTEVSYDDCVRVLERLGLDLPTRVQWTHAAQGGTGLSVWCGDDVSALSVSINCSDSSCADYELGGEPGVSWSDGQPCHAPVNSFQANPFGLHHTLGNVAEWCRDWETLVGEEVLPGEGLARTTLNHNRILLGGSFLDGLPKTSTDYEQLRPPRNPFRALGVRPIKRLEP